MSIEGVFAVWVGLTVALAIIGLTICFDCFRGPKQVIKAVFIWLLAVGFWPLGLVFQVLLGMIGVWFTVVRVYFTQPKDDTWYCVHICLSKFKFSIIESNNSWPEIIWVAD